MTCKCSAQCSFVLHTKVAGIVDRVKDGRHCLHQCGHTKSTDFLFNKLLHTRELHGDKYVVHFRFGGVDICGDVWCKLYGLRLQDSRMKRVLARLREGASEWVSSSSNKRGRRGWRGCWCSSWMREHVQKFADFNPSSRTAALDPDALETRHLLYMLDWDRRRGTRTGGALQFSRFNDLWREMMTAGYIEEGVKYDIVIRKPRSGFTCTICQLLMDRRRRAHGRTAKQSITHELYQHLQQVRTVQTVINPLGECCYKK